MRIIKCNACDNHVHVEGFEESAPKDWYTLYRDVEETEWHFCSIPCLHYWAGREEEKQAGSPPPSLAAVPDPDGPGGS